MANRTGRGSLIFGLILVALGGLFLMENWFGFFWLWSFVATWWPLILIAIGLRKIFRYFSLDTR